ARVNVLLGHGDGTFSDPLISDLDSGDFPSVAVGDFNADGKLDLVVSHFDTGYYPGAEVDVMLGTGDGYFERQGGWYGNSDRGDCLSGLPVGDGNGDSKVDVVPAYCDGIVRVPQGNGLGGFTYSGGPLSGGASGPSASVVLGDFNRDGKLDIATANSVDGTVSVFRGNGDGTFSAAEN